LRPLESWRTGPESAFGSDHQEDRRQPLNALKSTGPRTNAGKAAVVANSIGHGIFAASPVIKSVESAREWKLYRKTMLVSLAPAGMLETTLAE